MLRRISLLALFGISILWADVCVNLPAGAPKGLTFWPDADEDNPPSLSYHLSVKRGGPDFRITVRLVSLESRVQKWVNGHQPWSEQEFHDGDIEVAR